MDAGSMEGLQPHRTQTATKQPAAKYEQNQPIEPPQFHATTATVALKVEKSGKAGKQGAKEGELKNYALRRCA